MRDELMQLAEEIKNGILQLQSEQHSVVRRVDQILSSCKGSPHPGFPRDLCEFASIALAGHLSRELRRGDVRLVTGDEGTVGFHMWVEVEKHVIDITCDQFPGAPPSPVISRESAWHSKNFPETASELFASRFLKPVYFERSALLLSVALGRLEPIARANCRRHVERSA